MKKIIFASLLLSLTLTGCGLDRSQTEPSADRPAETRTVDIKNSIFMPATITIKTGDTIKWINQDAIPHQIQAESFNSETIAPGQTFESTFKKSGKFEYGCAIHPDMKGTVVVEK